jgi:enolase
VDTILDNLKIVEDAINACNAKDMFGIGLSWAADTLYASDTKKYESENPKTPFDNDQMIDYLVKLCTDKPIISYLEDPLAATELASWKKLKVTVALI